MTILLKKRVHFLLFVVGVIALSITGNSLLNLSMPGFSFRDLFLLFDLSDSDDLVGYRSCFFMLTRQLIYEIRLRLETLCAWLFENCKIHLRASSFVDLFF